MKVIIVLAAFVAVAAASKTHYGSPLVAAPLAPVALASSGTSSQFRSEDNYGNYQFGYDEAHATGSTSRREEQTNGVRHGSYSLSDADGRRRVVNYVADANGFRATIETNEPGVEPKDPADVLINKAVPVQVAAPLPVPVAAPLVAGPAPLPLPLPLPAPVAAPQWPAPLAAPIKGYPVRAPVHNFAPIAPAPLPVPAPIAAAPIAAPVAIVAEPATPRAFSYSFGATHQLPIAVPAPLALPAAPLPLPLPAQAPIFQQRIEAY